jgi:hypothetical protein
MSTKQHVIESECMDKLGWNISRVATATDTEMIEALRNYSQQIVIEKVVPSNPTAQEVVPSNPTAQEVVPSNQTAQEVVPSNPTTEKLEPEHHHHKIQLLRKQINKKSEFICSDGGFDDDMDVFKISIQKDKTLLDSMVKSVQHNINLKKEMITRKRKTEDLLISFRDNGTSNDDDDKLLLLIQRQLPEIEVEMNTLKRLL